MFQDLAYFYPYKHYQQFSNDDRQDSFDRQTTVPQIGIIGGVAAFAVGSAGIAYLDAIGKISDNDNELDDARRRLSSLESRLSTVEGQQTTAAVSLKFKSRANTIGFRISVHARYRVNEKYALESKIFLWAF